jgi:hypothetical protein
MTEIPIPPAERASQEGAGSPQPASLSSLGGRPMPATLPADFEALLGLPAGAQERFWDVLGPCLEATLGADADRAIEAFARRHEVLPKSIAHAIRGCRFLLYEAARSNADKHTVAADLGRLGGDQAEALRAILLPGFDAAIRMLRADIVRRSILDHGSLLVGVDWRVDRVLASQHGRGIDTPVGVITLTYQRGADKERVTLYCEPGMLQRLRGVCDEMLG